MPATPQSSFKDDEKIAHDASTRSSLIDVDTSRVNETKLLAKIDMRVLPFICIMYLLAFLDRVNVSNAAIFGLQNDLHLNGVQYSNCLVIFFVPYVLFEVPSNYFLKKFKPHVWLSLCMFGFGLTTMLQGFVQNYSGFLATRFFLGLFETGMFPGCFYLLAMWYRREESQKRYSFFFCSVTLAGAFGGLIATGIGHMDYVRGYRAWRWVFIIEGLVTAVLGIAWFFLLPDFPEEAKFLTEEERAHVRKRLQADVGASAHELDYTWRDILAVFKDYRIFLGGFMYFGCIVPAYGYAYFAPAIIKGLGFSNISTQLHSVPPWVCAFGLAMGMAYFSDKTKHRFIFGMIPALIGMTGFAILLSHPASIHLKYASLFLAVSGTYSAMPVFIGWFNMNLGGHLRRGVGSAWQIGFGNIGGIIASYTFPVEEAPRYTKGYALSVAFMIFAMASAVTYFFTCIAQNNAREKRIANGDLDDGLTLEEKELRGDLNVEFRYLL